MSKSPIITPAQYANTVQPLTPRRGEVPTRKPLIKVGQYGTDMRRKLALESLPPSNAQPRSSNVVSTREESFTAEMLTLLSRDYLMPLSRLRLNDLLYQMSLESPVINSGLRLNAALASTSFDFEVENDETMTREFNEMKDELDLEEIARSMQYEYLLWGESISPMLFDDDNRTWSRILLRPPQCFEVVEQPVSNEERLKSFPVTETKYYYYPEMYEQWKEKHSNVGGKSYRTRFVGVVTYSASRDFEVLDEFNVLHHYQHNVSGLTRGKSTLQSALFFWILERALWTAQFRVINDRLKYPDVWKIAIQTAPGTKPFADIQRLDDLDSALQESAGSPVDYIITYGDVSLDTAASGIRLLPIAAEVEFLQQMQMTSIWSEIGIQSGTRGYPQTFSSEWLWNQYRETRFKAIRERLYDYLIPQKVCFPVSVARGYTMKALHTGALKTHQYLSEGDQRDLRDLVEEHQDALGGEPTKHFNQLIEQVHYLAQQPRLDFGVDLSTRTRHAEKKEYVIPAVKKNDRIRLQDEQSKIETAFTLVEKKMVAPEAAALYIMHATGMQIDDWEKYAKEHKGSFLFDSNILKKLLEQKAPNELIESIKKWQLERIAGHEPEVPEEGAVPSTDLGENFDVGGGGGGFGELGGGGGGAGGGGGEVPFPEGAPLEEAITPPGMGETPTTPEVAQ